MPHNSIEYQVPAQALQDVITLHQILKRRERRRRRVAKRMAKRFPLFAVEFMEDEFPDYNYDIFVADVTRKTRKRKSMRRTKSPMIRQGRYALMQKALIDYRLTGEQRFLHEAQKIRNMLFKPYLFEFRLKGERRQFKIASTIPYKVAIEITKIKNYSTWADLDQAIDSLLKYY